MWYQIIDLQFFKFNKNEIYIIEINATLRIYTSYHTFEKNTLHIDNFSFRSNLCSRVQDFRL